MDSKFRGHALETIDNLLLYMEASRPAHRMRKATSEHRFSPANFRYAEPFNIDGLDVLSDEGMARVYGSDKDDSDPRKYKPINITLLLPNSKPEEERHLYAVRNWRTLPAQEARGKIKPFTPFVVEEKNATLYGDGTYQTNHHLWGWQGGIWREVKDFGSISHGDVKPDQVELSMALSHQHSIFREMLWHVSLGYVGMKSSLLIPCDATAVLDLFKFRELPEGAKRRASLLHWVSEHWRSKVTSPEDAVKVLEHLRGRTTFSWTNGIEVEIKPAFEDLKRLKDSAKKRELIPA